MKADKWEEKSVLITGGSSGVGLATAGVFLQQGANVTITGRDEERLERAVTALAPTPGGLSTYAGDVRAVASCEAAVQAVLARYGRLDVLVNSAGVWLEGPSEGSTEDEWDWVMDTNLKGTYFMCSRAIPALRQSRGCIINISSDAGSMGLRGAAIYCASKGGVNLLTKALALELAEDLVRVVAVCPADIDTPMLTAAVETYGGSDPESYLRDSLKQYPQGRHARFIQPEEVAQLVFYLASEAAGAITGALIPIDMGSTAG
jgi:NAD(P)-dependent dehydrogenase (short-subunit alcohol dehydrogenase family)